jgi:hypothetical protein
VGVIVSSGSAFAREQANGLLRQRARVGSLVVLFAVLLSLLVMGCGSSDNGVAAKPPAEILAATRAAAQNATSVRVVARATTRAASQKLDASMARNQGRAQVSVLGINFNVVRIGDTVYVKGNRAFNAGVERTLGVKVPSGVWLKGTTTEFSQVRVFTDVEKELPVMLGGSGAVTKGARIKIGGQSAITLKLTRKLYTGTLYVATTGQPYPLKLTKTGREHGQTTFTNWNDPVAVIPPAHAVAVSQLQPAKKGL